MMEKLQNLLNSFGIQELFSSPQNSLLTVIIVSLLLVSIILIFILLAAERRHLVKSRQLQAQYKLYKTRQDQSDAIFANDEQIMLIWPDQKSVMDNGKFNAKNVQSYGGLKNVIGLPKSTKDLLLFDVWLAQPAALKVKKALQLLMENGASFSYFVKTKAVERVEISGRVVGQQIILRIKDIKEDRLFLARANEKWISLEDKVKQFDALLNVSPLPTWHRDDAGQLTWVNDAYIQAVEAEDSINVLRDNIELIAPADIYKAREYFLNLDNGTTSPAIEGFQKDSSGNIKQSVFAVIKGERCHIQIQYKKLDNGIVATAYDVTKYELIKDELKRYNKAHKQTLDKLKTAIVQFGPDQKIEFYNRAYQKLFGVKPEFLDSKPTMSMILDEMRNLKKMPAQANFKQWREKQLEAFRQVETIDDWWHLPSGQTIHIIADPHPFGGVTFLYDDVTEHVALESRIHKLDHTQAETLDNLTDGVAVFNSDGELQISNPAFSEIWEFSETTLKNKPHVNKVLSWCEAQTDEKEIWKNLKMGVTAIVDGRKGFDGRVELINGKIVDCASIPLPNGATLMTFADVTLIAKSSNLLSERNEALIAADQLKTDFISHMSYQFREPLTNIVGFSEMMESQMVGELNEKQVEYIDIIKSSSIGLRALINDILDLASLDADRMALQHQQIEIVGLIEDAVKAVKLPIKHKNIILNSIIMPSIGSFSGDIERVSQILHNLLSNAIQFSDDDSIVSIGAEKEKTRIKLWVRDAGRGIAANQIDTVFDKFNSTDPDSAGLGLSLVKRLVEYHGGEVEITSQIDKGTIVSCYFPIEETAPVYLPNSQIKTIETSAASEVQHLEPELSTNDLNKTLDEGKKPSPREELALLRKKAKQEDKVLEVETVKTEENNKDSDNDLSDENIEEPAENLNQGLSSISDSKIFGNSRLAALYGRTKTKDSNMSSPTVQDSENQSETQTEE